MAVQLKGPVTRDQIRGLIQELVAERLAAEPEPVTDARESWIAEVLAATRSAAAGPAPERGRGLARLVRAVAAGKGDPERAGRWLRAQPFFDDKLDEAVTKALAASDAEAGGFLVAEEFSSDVIELLRPRSIVRRLGPALLPMPTGTLRIPKHTGGSTASYIGENTNTPASQPAFGTLVMTWKKLAALVPVSNDLLRFSSLGADTIIRNDTVAGMATRENLAFLRDPGTEATPKGLRHWAAAANVIPSTGATLTAMTSDLASLVLALEEADVAMVQPGWMFAPRTKQALMTIRDGNGNYVFRDEMLAGTLWGWPFGVTTQIPTNLGGGGNESEVYLVEFADVVIADATRLILDVSTEAAYVNESAQLVSAFSQDQTVVRVIAQHDLGVRHEESVAVLTGVQWAP